MMSQAIRSTPGNQLHPQVTGDGDHVREIGISQLAATHVCGRKCSADLNGAAACLQDARQRCCSEEAWPLTPCSGIWPVVNSQARVKTADGPTCPCQLMATHASTPKCLSLSWNHQDASHANAKSEQRRPAPFADPTSPETQIPSPGSMSKR